MSNFDGIYIENNQSPLVFLDLENYKCPELISSLQAFESSLFMIGLGRWTNAVISITTATELITSRRFKGRYEVQRIAFCEEHNISEYLREAARLSAKKRNQYIHSSTIPRDNADAIQTFFGLSLSVYTNFLAAEFDIDLFESIYDPSLRKNIKTARNIAKNHSQNTIPIGAQMSVVVKTIANLTHHYFTPQAMYLSPDESSASWERHDTYMSIQSDFESCCESDVIHPFQPNESIKVRCPAACYGFLSLETSHDIERYKFDSAKCCLCGAYINTPELIKEYVLSALSKGQIKDFVKSHGID
ncbi:hypothetical protein OAO72_06240 [Alphaproteobacteria bacterium]|nr:hypothetical protein [Alphaproteobacteria bacterium]